VRSEPAGHQLPQEDHWAEESSRERRRPTPQQLEHIGEHDGHHNDDDSASGDSAEAWRRRGKQLEERLQQTLQEQVEAVVAQPLKELQEATEELQKIQAERQNAHFPAP